ncbi:unnamed protein product [Rhizophagus irregularis]|nr:unnamed protein product [Rhizophagus irregularis]
MFFNLLFNININFIQLIYFNYRIENNKNEITTDQSDHSEPINSLTLAEDKAKWIPYNKFKDVECLDKGKFGLMHKAILSNGNKEVVLKHLDKNVEEFLKKVCMFKHYISCSESTEVFNVYGFTKLPDTPNCAVVMDFANKGSLRENLTKIIEMDWKQRLHILYKIISGLHEIHSQNLIHYNFHDGKILIHKENEEDAEDKFYISDLGPSALEIKEKIGNWIFYNPDKIDDELKRDIEEFSKALNTNKILESESSVSEYQDEYNENQLII